MGEEATKRYEKTKNRGSEAIVYDDQIPESVYDFTKPKVHVKTADLKIRKISISWEAAMQVNPSPKRITLQQEIRRQSLELHQIRSAETDSSSFYR